MLARRFILHLLVPLLLLVVGAEVTVYFLTTSHFRAAQERNLVGATEALDAAISARVASIEADANALASFPEVLQYFTLADFDQYEAASRQLNELEDRYAAVAELKPRCWALRLFDASGIALTSIEDRRRSYRRRDVSELPWFQAARDARTDDALISDVHPDLAHGLPVITICKPVRIEDRTYGVLAIDILVQKLAEDLLPAARASAGGHVYLVDPTGRVLASDVQGAPEGDLSGSLRSRIVPSGGSEVTVVTDESGNRIHVAFLPQDDTGLGLVLSVPEAVFLGPVMRMRNAVMIVTLAGLVAVSLLVLAMVRSIVRPVRQLTAGAARVAEGELDQSVDVRTGDELQELAESFNGMSRSLREAIDAKDRRSEQLQTAYEDLQQSHRQLAHAEKMGLLGQLAGGIAHDFNNLLSGILGCADLLKRGSGSPEDKERYIELILTAARRAADLVQQLLAFSRPGKTQQIPVDLNELVDEAVRILSRTVDPRIQVEKRLQSGPAMSRGDPSELQSALLNLGINARDAIEGNGTITYTTEVVEVDEDACRRQAHPIEPGLYLSIGVSDTGCGMGPDVLKHIFEPFFTTKGVGEGTGLGLAAVYGTVRGHSGSINVFSEPGRGTQFVLFLPLTSGESTVRDDAATDPGVVRGTGTLLLVDDEPILRNLGGDMLRELGYELVLASDGEEALETWRARRTEIDLVILDMVMPGMDGKEVLREIRRSDPKARVLITSGFQFDKDAPDVRSEGAVGFLPKPFIMTSLSRAVAAALTSSPGGRRLRVLCADDSAVNRTVLEGLLSEMGHQAVIVEDGERALEAARRRRFDLVLLDLEMPRMGGLDAARALREKHGAGLPILGMSGMGSPANEDRCLDAGMDGLIPKPLSMDVLQTAIDARLGQQGRRGARDEGLRARLAQAFVEETPRLLDELRTAVAQGDTVALHRAAHTLHGSLRHFDATRASELSDRLQHQAGVEDLVETEELAGRLAEECERLVEILGNGKEEPVNPATTTSKGTK